MTARFTSFATYQDLVAFIKCLEKGNSSTYCYSKGDNGVGASGLTTAQIHTPMCALPASEMIAKWGSKKASFGKLVNCTIGNKTVKCTLADIGPPGVCDLNPAALIAFGFAQDKDLSVSGTWTWA